MKTKQNSTTKKPPRVFQKNAFCQQKKQKTQLLSTMQQHQILDTKAELKTKSASKSSNTKKIRRFFTLKQEMKF